MENQSPNLTAGGDEPRFVRAWARLTSRIGNTLAWVKKAARKDREVHYTREDQLMMAALAHGLILLGVLGIVGFTFDGVKTGQSLHYFYWCEIAIVAVGILATISTRQVVTALDKTVVDLDRAEEWMNDRPGLKRKVQTGVLGVMFVLQFASMAALLEATGGPIDSPFAPMALGIGVFTPFILNQWWSVALVILATMLFYGLLTSLVGFGGSGERPDPGAFATVNLFILAAASVATLRRRDALSFKLRKFIKASPQRIWHAWTDEAQVAHWTEGDAAPQISLDVREGGGWRVTLPGPDGGEPTRWSGTYIEVDQPRRLVFTVAARSGIGAEIISVDLKQRGVVTEMVVTQTDQGRFEGLKTGWSGFVEQLAGFVTSAAGRRSHGKSDG
jgi:uncharacterized protein YndB with AHSA1/START domain